MLINKHTDQDLNVEISISGNIKVNNIGKIWLLNGPNIMAQNDGKPETVKIKEIEINNVKNNFKYTLPAHSVTAMEIETQ